MQVGTVHVLALVVVGQGRLFGDAQLVMVWVVVLGGEAGVRVNRVLYGLDQELLVLLLLLLVELLEVCCWFCSLVWLQSVVLISYFWSLYDNLLPCLSIPDNLDFIVDDTSFPLIRSTNRRLVLILSCVTPW